MGRVRRGLVHSLPYPSRSTAFSSLVTPSFSPSFTAGGTLRRRKERRDKGHDGRPLVTFVAPCFRVSVSPVLQPPLRYGPILPVSSVHPSPYGSLREVNGTRWEDGA